MGTRYVALGKESTYGTSVAATRYIDAEANINPDHNWIISPSIGSRADKKKQLGFYRAKGNIGDFEVEPENIGELLHGVFGSVSSAQQGSTVAYLHTFTPADTLPSYTARLGVEQTQRILPGCLIEALTLKFEAGKAVRVTAEILSGFPEAKAAIGTPTLSELNAFTMFDSNSVLTIGGSSKRSLVYALEVTIKNNIPFDKGALDGRTFSVKRYGKREITGKISMFFDDTTEYDRFIAGTDFNLVNTAVGPNISGIYNYQLDLDLRKCVYLKDTVPAIKPQNEALVIDAPFKAFYDSTGGFNAEGKATLQNTITSY